MLPVFDAEEAALEKLYYLKCKITIKPITYDDVQSKGTTRRTEEMAFLTPIESTQKTLFLMAWLPDVDQKPTEIVALMGHPVSGPVRLSVHRPDHRMNENYLFVMTKSAEEILKHVNGKEIEVQVLPKTDDQIGDLQRDYDLAENKNKGQHVDTQKGIELQTNF